MLKANLIVAYFIAQLLKNHAHNTVHVISKTKIFYLSIYLLKETSVAKYMHLQIFMTIIKQVSKVLCGVIEDHDFHVTI